MGPGSIFGSSFNAASPATIKKYLLWAIGGLAVIALVLTLDGIDHLTGELILGFSIFGSSSSSKSSNPNSSITASDNALVNAPKRSNNSKTKTVTRLGKGASLTINNGLSEEQFNKGLGALASSLSAAAANNPQTTADDSGFQQAVLMALGERTKATTDLVVDDIQASKPSSVNKYLWWGIGAVVLVALVLSFSGKKKKK